MTVISQHRFDPGLIELRRLIDDGALGRLLLGQAATKWYRSQSYYDSAAWRGTWSLDGGALMNQGIHYADLLRWCMGPVAEVHAVTATQAHDMEAEDCALAIVRFASGAVGTITASTAVFPGFAQRLEISGTDGTVIIEDSVITYRGFRGELPDQGMTGSSVLTGATVPAVGGQRRRPRGRRARHAARRPARGAGRGPRAAGHRRRRPGHARAGLRGLRVGARKAGRSPCRCAGRRRAMTVILSGFADEISPDPGEQLETLAAHSISHLELRSAWSTNVADLDDRQVAAFRQALAAAGVRVSAIGSPIGKTDIGAPLAPELDRMRRVADIAAELGTGLVRVFSFYIPPGQPPEGFRTEVIDRMAALAEIARDRGLVLAHENEKEIYGDVPQRCADLIASVGSPALRATFDAANFVQCGVAPHTRGVSADPALSGVPAGQGRAGRHGRGRSRGPGRRPGARDPRRAGRLGIRGLRLAGAAPGRRRPSRRLQRPGRFRAGPRPHSRRCWPTFPCPGDSRRRGSVPVE